MSDGRRTVPLAKLGDELARPALSRKERGRQQRRHRKRRPRPRPAPEGPAKPGRQPCGFCGAPPLPDRYVCAACAARLAELARRAVRRAGEGRPPGGRAA